VSIGLLPLKGPCRWSMTHSHCFGVIRKKYKHSLRKINSFQEKRSESKERSPSINLNYILKSYGTYGAYAFYHIPSNWSLIADHNYVSYFEL